MSDDWATKTLTMAEMAVADMAEAGLTPQQIAIGLAASLIEQVNLAMPTAATRTAFMLALVGAPRDATVAAFAAVLRVASGNQE